MFEHPKPPLGTPLMLYSYILGEFRNDNAGLSDADARPGKNKITQSKVVYSINRLILLVILFA